MEEKYYAILMNKKILETGIYYYSPISLIEGKIENEDSRINFTDSLGNEYLAITDSEMLFNDMETGICFVIEEKALLKKYGVNSLDEAKARYFEETCSLSYLGFYVAKYDKIGVLPMDFKKLSNQLNESVLNEKDDTMTVDLSSFMQANYDGEEQWILEEQECIAIEISHYMELLQSKTYDEVMEKLQTIYQQAELINQSMQSENNILTKLEEAYQAFSELKTIEEMKEVLTSLRDYYIELIVKIDELGKTEKTKEATDYLYQLIDAYENILKIKDIEIIREEILKMKETSKKSLMRYEKTYEEEKELQRRVEVKEQKEAPKTKPINVREIKSYFDQVIIGQEEAKKDVISAIVMNKLVDDLHAKNSCLLVGPTGSGKTLIAETVSKYFDMPMEIIDTTQLTVPGYVGANIEDFLVRLLEKADGNIQKAEEGIVVFDEIDKKGSKENGDISGKGVLNTLLPFIQGTTYSLKYNGRVVPFNTSKLTIFATGAFTDVAKAKKEDKVSNSYSNSNIGFNAKMEENKNETDVIYEKLEPEDFVKYGNMPIEIIGRFSTIAQLSGHTKESLKKILTDSILSPLITEQATLAKINIYLTWEEEYLNAVVEEALKLKTGARSLKNIVEKSIKMARWEALSYPGEYSGIHLIAKTVEDNYNCELIGSDGSVYQLKEILGESNVLKRERKC